MKHGLPLAVAATFTLSACAGVPNDTASGAAVGGVVGAIAATALGADTRELVLGTAMGATIGAAAGNQGGGRGTARCIYQDPRGGSYEEPC